MTGSRPKVVASRQSPHVFAGVVAFAVIVAFALTIGVILLLKSRRGTAIAFEAAPSRPIKTSHAATVSGQRSAEDETPLEPATPPRKAKAKPNGKTGKKPTKSKPKKAHPATVHASKAAENRAVAPDEAKLIDNTIIKLPVYGATYQGYDYRPPIDVNSAELEFVLGNAGPSSINFDVKHGRMYWLMRGEPAGIARSNLDGTHRETILTDLDSPQRLAIDVERNRMFWTERDRHGGQHTVKAADLDGTNWETLVKGASSPGGIAVDPKTGDVYFCDKGTRRMHSDGTNEAQIMKEGGSDLILDPAAGKLYWTKSPGGRIWTANLDGTDAEIIADVGGGQISSFALDPQDQKFYWVNGYHSLRRCNMDGSQVELLMVVPPIHQNAEFRGIGEVAVLAEQRILYVGRGGNDAHETGRMKIPPLPTPVTKPAPPQVTSIAPLRQSIGGEVVVMGAGFTGATKVAIFDDAAGNEVLVRFELRSDSELSFKMPTLSKHCRHAAIIVLTPGGVTVTLPKLCSVAKPLIWNLLPDTRQVKTVEKQGQNENIWYVVGQPKILQGTHHPTHLTRKDGILAYVEPFAEAYTGQRGHNVLFVKDAAISTVPWRSVVYHEPFALIWPPVQESLEEMETRLIAVPAIRPSLLEELLEYKQPSE